MDLFFYREPEEAEKEEQAAKEPVILKVDIPEPTDLEAWNPPEPTQWSEEPAPAVAQTIAPAPAAYANPDDWASEVQGEWANSATGQPTQPNWGAGSSEWH